MTRKTSAYNQVDHGLWHGLPWLITWFILVYLLHKDKAFTVQAVQYLQLYIKIDSSGPKETKLPIATASLQETTFTTWKYLDNASSVLSTFHT